MKTMHEIVILMTICCVSIIYANGDTEITHDYDNNVTYHGVQTTYTPTMTPDDMTTPPWTTQRVMQNQTTTHQPKNISLWMWNKLNSIPGLKYRRDYRKVYTSLEVFAILCLGLIGFFSVLFFTALIHKSVRRYRQSGWCRHTRIPTTSL